METGGRRMSQEIVTLQVTLQMEDTRRAEKARAKCFGVNSPESSAPIKVNTGLLRHMSRSWKIAVSQLQRCTGECGREGLYRRNCPILLPPPRSHPPPHSVCGA
uniref:Uncharacterized protein n=1 Tax=Knipowitschia caucasica TaxID=637954 RepID=A0AAV2JCL1_KNICA